MSCCLHGIIEPNPNKKKVFSEQPKLDSSRLSSKLYACFLDPRYLFVNKVGSTSAVKHVYSLGRYLPTGGLGNGPVT